MKDPYQVLGVSQDASAEDIKSAYRNLAKKWHPDLNPTDKTAEDSFKEISAAFEILGDEEKREKYDLGEIDAGGAEKPDHRYYKHYAGGEEARRYQSDINPEDLEGIFSSMFARGHGETRQQFRVRGADVRYQLAVEFLEAAKGATKRITLPDGTLLDVTIPQGVMDGKTIRLRGKGQPGLNGGTPGDALIEIAVKPHQVFRRDGDDVVIDLPITLDEAILGGQVEVPTIDGRVQLAIPKGSNSGKILRLKNRGIKPVGASQAGDQKCTLKIMLPEKIDSNLSKFISKWRNTHAYNPRSDLRVKS